MCACLYSGIIYSFVCEHFCDDANMRPCVNFNYVENQHRHKSNFSNNNNSSNDSDSTSILKQ